MEASSPVNLSRPETTEAVTRGAGRLLWSLGYAPMAEVSLPNGRRADLMVDVVVGDQILQALLVEMVVAAQFEAIAQGQDIEFELAALAVVGLVLVLS